MGKSKSTKKTTAKTRKPAKAAVTTKEPEKKAQREDLCVFAFRLTPEERDAIHKAAGAGKASRFVRTLAVAAAKSDEASVRAVMKKVQANG